MPRRKRTTLLSLPPQARSTPAMSGSSPRTATPRFCACVMRSISMNWESSARGGMPLTRTRTKSESSPRSAIHSAMRSLLLNAQFRESIERALHRSGLRRRLYGEKRYAFCALIEARCSFSQIAKTGSPVRGANVIFTIYTRVRRARRSSANGSRAASSFRDPWQTRFPCATARHLREPQTVARLCCHALLGGDGENGQAEFCHGSDIPSEKPVQPGILGRAPSAAQNCRSRMAM